MHRRLYPKACHQLEQEAPPCATSPILYIILHCHTVFPSTILNGGATVCFSFNNSHWRRHPSLVLVLFNLKKILNFFYWIKIWLFAIIYFMVVKENALTYTLLYFINESFTKTYIFLYYLYKHIFLLFMI